MILERKQSRVILFGPAKVKFRGVPCFRRNDRIPEEPGSCPELIKARVGTSIFIVDRLFKLYRQNGGDRSLIFIRHTNLQCLALTED